jgi:hypothetical protein
MLLFLYAENEEGEKQVKYEQNKQMEIVAKIFILYFFRISHRECNEQILKEKY